MSAALKIDNETPGLVNQTVMFQKKIMHGVNMDKKELDEIRRMVANESHALSTPIDFDALISEGLLKKVGKSYYTDNIKLLPEMVRKKIKTMSNGRYGIKLTFYKETKSMTNLSNKFEQFRG